VASCENCRHAVIVKGCSLFRDALHRDITCDLLRGNHSLISAADLLMQCIHKHY
jgi:hypothetical protein